MISDDDEKMIFRIAFRASDIRGGRRPAIDIAAELEIVHEEIVPLRLKEMQNASVADLMRDVDGIAKHLSIGRPSTFTECFLPRFATNSVSRDA